MWCEHLNWNVAIGEQIMFAVCLICVDYFYRAEKRVRVASEAEYMDLAFAPQIHYGHSCSLTESHSIYFLCVCVLNLKQEFG